MRAINVALAFLVSLAIFFGVFELGLRLFPAFRPPTTINQFDPKLGWVKEPGATNSRSTAEFSITFEINDQGLRDDPVAIPKPEGTYRVVCLGDSFVLGYTVDREDLFVDLLEDAWTSDARRIEVVNAGTEGWSTDQQVVWFQEHGAAMDADLVLLFPYENDVYWASQASYYRFPKPRFTAEGTVESDALEDPGPEPFLARLAAGRALGLLAQQLLGGTDPHSFEVAEGVTIRKEFAPLLLEAPDFVEESWGRVGGALRALQSAVGEAELVVCPIPSESAIQPESKADFAESKHTPGMQGVPETDWSPDVPVDRFLALAQGLGIRTLDPRTALRTAYQANSEEPLYFEREWHLTPRGNRELAAFLADELSGEGDAVDTAAFAARTSEGEGGLPTWLLVYLALWGVLGTAYAVTYKGKEAVWRSYVGVGLMLGSVFAIILGFGWLLERVPPSVGPFLTLGAIVVILGFILYKLGRRLGTIAELMRAFTLRGHWYLMPLVVVLLSIGSLLVVAASSPLVAPFIYTLF